MGEASKVHLTYADYERMPEDGNRYEIIEGKLAVTPTPTLLHQFSLKKLHLVFEKWVDEGAGGVVFFAPLTVKLADDSIVEPDLFWIAAAQMPPLLSNEKIVEGTPDLLVEVLSPSTKGRDRGVKLKLYAKYGVREYWLVDPIGRSVEILALADGTFQQHAKGSGDQPLSSRLDPRLSVVPARLFWNL